MMKTRNKVGIINTGPAPNCMYLSTKTLPNDVSHKHCDENKAGRIYLTVLC